MERAWNLQSAFGLKPSDLVSFETLDKSFDLFESVFFSVKQRTISAL